MHGMARTKIVCTIGPATSSPKVLRGLVQAGMDVARLNFSHGTHEQHGEVIDQLRLIAAELNANVAILQDLCGPKIRIGNLETEVVQLHRGSTVELTTEVIAGNAERITVNYEALCEDLAPRDTVLVADGDIELCVESIGEGCVCCRVITGGYITARKGVHFPRTRLGLPALTDKDKLDAKFGVEMGVDWIALSFVRDAGDVEQMHAWVRACGGNQPIIAKIEKREALENIDAIIRAADGIMVARGDLGVEVSLPQVPIAQKRIIAKANRAAVPVITATQMLRSMVDNPRPTRAEVSDVANSIFDGTDAVMLSEETAAGKYPRRSVVMLERIAATVEAEPEYYAAMRDRELIDPSDVGEAMARAAVDTATALGAAAIICPTVLGSSPKRVARYRPRQPVIAFSPNMETVRQLALSWGVRAFPSERCPKLDDLLAEVQDQIAARELLPPGARVVYSMASPLGAERPVSFLRVESLP